MSAPEAQRRPSNRYIEYLHLYSQRARKSAPGPALDGAGLVCGTRYHGRNTPLKVRGRDSVEVKRLTAAAPLWV